ncbi:hypothetical protein [Georgenia sp. H159]|uniref:hypothetical protein n=1 Tax=Georgenia sp. H159 TaxID=3076115 RepID=UPI002D777E20|nr:hypothetical protein [Georgenia sp. H159]
MASRPRWWSFAAVGGLVVVNVVLIALLVLRPTAPSVDERSEAAGATAEGPQQEIDESGSRRAKQDPGELAPAEGVESLPQAQRLLVNLDATTAWRATVGDCAHPGALEHTVDGGRTWQARPLELAPVSRLRVLGAESLFAIGGGADCEPTYVSSANAGASWSTHDEYLSGSWYQLPDDRDVLSTPVGEVDAPCEVVELAALNAVNAAVLCADASLALTQDGGASWSGSEPGMDVEAVGVAADAYAIAGADDSCGDRLAVATMSIDGAAEPVCTDEGADVTQIAVSASAGAMWLWLDDHVVVATDW